jgi:DHA2 family methylenomycin A resistance protein-like MFS transporter
MTDAGAPPGLRRRDIIGVGFVAGSVSINSTMIAVALPDIADDFDIAIGKAGLLITMYLVVMLVGQPIAGRLTDRLGARRLITVGLVGFALASVAATLANSFELLVAIRSAQAVCAIFFVPGAQALLRLLSTPAKRGQAFGVLGSFLAGGAAIGPVLGGLLTAGVGWAGVFLVNLPIVAIALVLLKGMATPNRPAATTAVDTLPIRSLATPRFVAAFATQASTTFGQYALLLVIPVVLDARGWNAGAIGGALTALTLGMVIVGPAGGRFGDKNGRRRPVVIGTTVATVATVLAAVAIEGSATLLIVAVAAFGFGLGFAIPNVQTMALEAVPAQLAGSASGILSMSRYVGSIPSTLLLAFIVGDDGSDARTFLLVASAVVASSVAMSFRIPSKSGGSV